MVITIYVHMFFTLPWFSSVKLWENKLDKKLPKNCKRMKTAWNFGTLAVWESPYCLKYRSFGSLMPGHYIECHYAESLYGECYYMSVHIQSVIKLNVIMLNVMAPSNLLLCLKLECNLVWMKSPFFVNKNLKLVIKYHERQIS